MYHSGLFQCPLAVDHSRRILYAPWSPHEQAENGRHPLERLYDAANVSASIYMQPRSTGGISLDGADEGIVPVGNGGSILPPYLTFPNYMPLRNMYRWLTCHVCGRNHSDSGGICPNPPDRSAPPPVRPLEEVVETAEDYGWCNLCGLSHPEDGMDLCLSSSPLGASQMLQGFEGVVSDGEEDGEVPIKEEDEDNYDWYEEGFTEYPEDHSNAYNGDEEEGVEAAGYGDDYDAEFDEENDRSELASAGKC